MAFYRHISRIFSAAVLRIAAPLACLFLNVFFVRAQDSDARVRLYFPFDNASLDAHYMSNESALESLDSLTGRIAEGSMVSIMAFSSPEGNVRYNQKLSVRRAKAVASYIETAYPALKDRIHIASDAEAWKELRSRILSDIKISKSTREQVIAIIDSNLPADKKESSLKAIDGYKVLYNRHFRSLRYAEIFLTIDNCAEAEENIEISEFSTIKEDTLSVAHVTSVIAPAEYSATLTQPESGSISGAAPVVMKKGSRNMIAAVKTNLLYDAATALNFEVEVPIANRFSVMAEDTFPWWEYGNKYCFQLWEMGVEARYWFKPWETRGTEKLRGLFAGPYVMSGKYDFQYDKSINYQGEFWSVGATAGYAMPIGRKKKVNLEFSLSMGYMRSPFRHYIPTDDYTKLIRDNDRTKNGVWNNYFRYPTKAKVSLVVPISFGKKEARHE
ncbi:MAG: DUF3575 domain-containing protein [Bacteroidales bacterium]|nr:DUF3575 domain-containing protein [Bacteroidales bacterium]